jgi:hypothetical protein
MELTYTKSPVNLNKLTKELVAISGLSSLTHSSSLLTIIYSRDLDISEQTQVGTIVNNHTSIDSVANISIAISNAIDFGKQLIIEFGIENILLGVTTTQIKVMLVQLEKVLSLLMSGALYTAIEELEIIIPDLVLTQQRINYYNNRIRTYVGLPLI